MSETKLSRLKLLIASMPLIFLLAVIFGATPNVSMAKISPENAVLFDSGSDYSAQCARCHGGDGRGQTAKGRQTHAGDLTKSTVSDTKGIRMITNGSGEMPAFKSSMSAEQIKGVMNYVRGFRR
ncbi:MAG: cytochrome c [Pyrinomonadaceae bacterium]